jgi:hypothetical protein
MILKAFLVNDLDVSGGPDGKRRLQGILSGLSAMTAVSWYISTTYRIGTRVAMLTCRYTHGTHSAISKARAESKPPFRVCEHLFTSRYETLSNAF